MTARHVISEQTVREACSFYRRAPWWLSLRFEYRVAAAFAYGEVYNRGRLPVSGMFGCAFSRTVPERKTALVSGQAAVSLD